MWVEIERHAGVATFKYVGDDFAHDPDPWERWPYATKNTTSVYSLPPDNDYFVDVLIE